MSRRQVFGFTLLELMVTVAVAAILLALALPSFQQTLRSNRVATSTNALLGALALARSEAIRTTHTSSLCASSSGTACGGTWTDGFLVWTDSNANGVLNAGETVKFSHGSESISLTGAGNSITFDARGRPSAAAILTLKATTCGSAQLQRRVEVRLTGQVSTSKESCS